MDADYLPRSRVDPSHYAAIDSELKSLKLLSRRIQSAMATHLAELQILHRLFYKNKNQHRGALFWRNISEVRRYADKLRKLDVLNTMTTFRNAFYGPENSPPGKGPWTHIPSNKSILNFEKKCDVALKLSQKTSTICLDAYRMFHRSMQSGAFLQVLLMFIAITSRIELVSAELVDIFTSVKSSVTRVSGTSVVTERVCILEMTCVPDVPAQVKESQTTEQIPAQSEVNDSLSMDVAEDTIDATEVFSFGIEKKTKEMLPQTAVSTKQLDGPASAHVIPESKRQKVQTEPPTRGKEASSVAPKKKKRKVAKNEIDDIFGF